MRCLVVLLLLAGCASLSAAAGVPCALSLDFFGRHNVTADDKDVPGAYHRGSLSNGLDGECAYHLKYQQMTSILSGRSGDRRTRRSADLACHP
ncbi:hypothetical protein SFRURICE_010618 [Spodoptera frugiperda]|nr:hypothetical protein SFRURICE_010618 [Spodoptera frugiperda]